MPTLDELRCQETRNREVLLMVYYDELWRSGLDDASKDELDRLKEAGFVQRKPWEDRCQLTPRGRAVVRDELRAREWPPCESCR